MTDDIRTGTRATRNAKKTTLTLSSIFSAYESMAGSSWRAAERRRSCRRRAGGPHGPLKPRRLRGRAGCSGVVFGGPPCARMLHLNLKAKRYSCRGGKYACRDVLGFLRFDPSPEICSQTSQYSTSHWAHAVQQRWCIELRLHQILEKCC